MKTVKVFFADNDSITTQINGTDEEIRDYYRIGRLFNIGTNGNDNMQAVVKVKILDENWLLADSMQNSWTAKVELENGLTETFWYTAWPSGQRSVKRVLSISSDYPRHSINN